MNIRIYIHYPNQVLRTVFGKDVAWKSILNLNKMDLDPSVRKYQVLLLQMTVIKRRPDGKIPCKTDDSDDSRYCQRNFR